MASKLLVDLGNTQCKWTCVVEGEWQPAQGLAYRQAGLESRLTAAWRDVGVPDSIWVATVAGDAVTAELTRVCEQLWPQTPVNFATTQARGFGVVGSYRQPRRFGVDRWLALVAARAQVAGPVCIVDAGTAVTLDAMDAHGKHQGGLILPGLVLAIIGLTDGTGHISLQDQPKLVQRAENTEDAVYSGVYWSIVTVIEKFVTDFQREQEAEVVLVLTGGDAAAINDSLSLAGCLEPDLVLQGLNVVST